ncbi:MAG: carboxypeptidase regulatory-like domain-containing protein [Pyrinomonadaceae bacterium]|nr:carboxypeptidase regulatory-like domain-containing protein [Pyrinomonadaceae bacterium]
MKKPRREFLVKRASATLVTALLVVTFSLICVGMQAHAQSTDATLSGMVIDPNGAVVPGAVVTIVKPDTGFTREATTNESGIYTFLATAPGKYTVTVRRDGFAPAEIKDVVLNVNDRRSLQTQLRVGQVGETVVVNDGASLINESPTVSTVIDRTLVERLPLPGRSFQGLIALSPGVVLTESTNSDQGQFSVNGQRRSSNAFYVDGVSANFGGASAANLGQFAGGSLPAFSAQGGPTAWSRWTR